MKEISRQKAIAISNDIIDNLCLDDKQLNQKLILKSFERFGLIKPEVTKEQQCKGQMDIFDYPEYCPDDNMDLER